MKLAMTPMEKVRAAAKFLDVRANQRPLSVSIEVTKRCNARCDFCDYWKISDRDELTDFTGVIRRFDPLVVVFTGGEPMLRRDLAPIVKSIKDMPGFRYLTLLTHGGFLSEKKIEDLVAAGVIDPAMVTRSALQNAASIAKNILTTEAIVAEVPEKDGGGAAGGGMPDMSGMM